MSLRIKAILIFLYCIGTANNLIAANEKDIAVGLGDLSINIQDEIIDGDASSYNTENESIESNAGVAEEVGAVSSNKGVLNSEESDKAIKATTINPISDTPYNTSSNIIIIKDSDEGKELHEKIHSADRIKIICTKCKMVFVNSQIFGASREYLRYHTKEKKRDCMFDDENKPYAHMVFFFHLSVESDCEKSLTDIKKLVNDPLCVETVLSKGNDYIKNVIRCTQNVLTMVNKVQEIKNDSVHEKSNSTPIVTKHEIHENNNNLPATVDTNCKMFNNINCQENSLIHEPVLTEQARSKQTFSESDPSKLTPFETVPSKLTPFETAPSKSTLFEATPSKSTLFETAPSKTTLFEAAPSKLTSFESVISNKYSEASLSNECPETVISNECSEVRGMEYTANNSISHAEMKKPQQQVTIRYPQFKSFTAREASFTDPNWISKQQTPADLAEAGFFYTGEGDIVRCFCCDLGLAEWNHKDNVWREHARHCPKCWFLNQEKGSEYIAKVQEEWKKIYNPKHVVFEDSDARINSYHGWRMDIEQTPEMLAAAGFFYTGEEDIVRCHYCDGGLRHWEPGDDPWEEHARWFRGCKFVIKMKGTEYIDEVIKATELKYLKREREDQEQGVPILKVGGFVMSTESKEFLDSVEFKNNEEIEVLFTTYGIDKETIACAVIEYRKKNSNWYFIATDIATFISNKNKDNDVWKAKSIILGENTDDKDLSPDELRQLNIDLKQSLKCIKCNENEKCMLFIKCGHRITCESCAKDLTHCPECNKKTGKKVKTFLSDIGTNKHDYIKLFMMPIYPVLKTMNFCLANILLLQNNVCHINWKHSVITRHA